MKRALRAADAKLGRLLEEAKADLALIARRRAEIVDSFYDIGEALRRLKRREIIAALGRKSFAEVCDRDARISVSQAGRLIDIVEHMSRTEAVAMGQSKASALVGLADATPEQDTRRTRPAAYCAAGSRWLFPGEGPSICNPRARGPSSAPRSRCVARGPPSRPGEVESRKTTRAWAKR